MERASPSSARAVRALRHASDSLSKSPLDALSTDDHLLYLQTLLPSFMCGMWNTYELQSLCSANIVALYGWQCIAPFTLRCIDCGVRLALDDGTTTTTTSTNSDNATRDALRKVFVDSLQSTHHVACVWRAHRVDAAPLFCPSAHTAVAQYHRRVNTWSGHQLPQVVEKEEMVQGELPQGVSRNAHVLAVCGWERAVPSNTEPTAYCRLCARHVWIDQSKPFGKGLAIIAKKSCNFQIAT